jgi:phosphatidylserine decarboxylase
MCASITDARVAPAASRARASVRRVPGLARGTPAWLGGVWALWLLALERDRRLRTLALGAVPAVVTWFFRDPEREIAEAPVVAAADGVVRDVEAHPDGRTRVVTYLNLLDVHVTRTPVAGTITSVERRPGGWVPAFRKEAERNERLVWWIDSPLGGVEVVEIAGTVARRIVLYAHAGETVERGERIGLIRFGSRVDVYLPAGIEPAVRVGQRVRAGVTPLARESAR